MAAFNLTIFVADSEECHGMGTHLKVQDMSPLHNISLGCGISFDSTDKRGDPSIHSAPLHFSQDDVSPWMVSVRIAY